MNIGIIGYGYWGPNLVRNFYANNDCNVIMVADKRPERLRLIETIYPKISCVLDADQILTNNQIDAVVIATPVNSHFELAKLALENGKHVLLEKPMTRTIQEAEILIDLAIKKNKTLMVDHTFLYTGAVQKMKELVNSNELGKINYFDSTRINLGLFQEDCNVLWDLAPHDLSILNYLVDEKPISVNATGISHTKNGIENIAYLTLNFQSGMIAHFNCSWTSPVKIRTSLIGGDKKMIVYNDIEPTEKIKVYDTGYSFNSDEDKKQLLIDYRVGDVYIPKLETTEALQKMTTDFINAIKYNTRPISDHNIGIAIVSILEKAEESLKSGGKEIKL